jgi:hypothetical protein
MPGLERCQRNARPALCESGFRLAMLSAEATGRKGHD